MRCFAPLARTKKTEVVPPCRLKTTSYLFRRICRAIFRRDFDIRSDGQNIVNRVEIFQNRRNPIFQAEYQSARRAKIFSERSAKALPKPCRRSSADGRRERALHFANQSAFWSYGILVYGLWITFQRLNYFITFYHLPFTVIFHFCFFDEHHGNFIADRIDESAFRLVHFKPLSSGFNSTFDLHFGQRRISKSSGLNAINFLKLLL